MARITKHSKQRIVERVESATTVSDAKKMEKQARLYGKCIDAYIRYPKFFSYLQNKKGQTNSCSVRIYKDHIFIWRGKMKSLVTAHEIPERYVEEMREINDRNGKGL